jgi:CRISPR-associated protein Cmr1
MAGGRGGEPVSWTTIRLRTTTPLFNAGGDGDAGVRVPSLLGSMRFWFRALAGARLGPDLEALRRWESRVFGGAAVRGAGSSPASGPVQWRMTSTPTVLPAGRRPDWLRSFGRRDGRHGPPQGNDRWIVYLLGQGLGNLRDCTLQRDYVPPGEVLQLALRQRRREDATLGLALTSLWLTSAFGGIGARTRRGFGGFRIVDVDGPALPPPWDALDLTAPPTYPGLRRLFPEPAGRSLALFGPVEAGRPLMHRWERQPDHAVLGGDPRENAVVPAHAHLGVQSFSTWYAALADAGEAWRWMRASVDAPEAHYHPKRKTKEWQGVVRGPGTAFPLGALGLPVVYKDGWQVNLMEGSQHLRRASPVWIRPVEVDGRWRIFTFVFRCRLLPDHGSVEVRQGQSKEKQVDVTLRHLDGWWDDWKANLSPSTSGAP